MDPRDRAAFLLGSAARPRLLQCLREETHAPRELVDRLDVSRASVQRNLAAFDERDWVRRDAGTYSLTSTGRHVARVAERFLDGIEGVERAAPVLERLPTLDQPPASASLVDCEVVVADDDRPHAPVERYLDWLDGLDCGRIRGFTPVLSGVFDDAHADLIERGVETELVLGSNLVERTRRADDGGFDAALSIDGFRLYEHPDGIEFGLSVASGETVIGGYDGSGRLEACLHGDHPDLVEWAVGRYRAYRECSTELTPG